LKFGSVHELMSHPGKAAEAAAKGLPAGRGDTPATPGSTKEPPDRKLDGHEKGRPTENFSPPAQTGEASTGNTANDKAATLFSKDSTDQQKLSAARDLAKSGMTHVDYKDSAGNEHKATLELENAGKNQMVHVYEPGANGKNQVALRGISKADGTFEQERNRSGHFVSYEGSGFSQLSANGQATPGDVKPAQPGQPANPGDGNPAQPTQPAKPGDGNPAQPAKPGDGNPAQPAKPGDGNAPQPDAPAKPGDGKSDQPATPGKMDRSQFDKQLNDPRVMAAFAGRVNSEVGSQGHAQQVAFAEEVMNRAASRGQTLMQALSGKYYPTHTPDSSHDPALVGAIKEAWKGGTDTIHGATGNASGHVGFGVKGGHYDASHQWVSPNQVARIGGERFGYEQNDLNKGWLQKYQQLKGGS
jgi:hypothetical protein